MKEFFSRISRRNFLSGLFASVGLASMGISFIRSKGKPALAFNRLPVLNNRYRKKTPVKIFVANLVPGFYVCKKRPKSSTSVIHYVQADKRIRGVQSLDETKLQPWNPLRKDAVPRPHVNRSTASYSLENAALAHLTSNPPRPEIACELLLLGISDDLAMRRKFRQSLISLMELRSIIESRFSIRERVDPRYRDRMMRVRSRLFGRRKVPVRLYDLLAGVSVRYAVKFDGNRTYLQHLIGLVEENVDLKTALSRRLSTWKDSRKRWHSRWASLDIEWNKIKLPTKLEGGSSK